MKNLNDYVERVWAATTPEDKLSAFQELVKASHATAIKKQVTLRQALGYSMQQLDSAAINYAMAGEGLKVIK